MLVEPETPTGTPAGDDRHVALLEVTRFLGQLGGGVDQVVGGLYQRHHHGHDAPGEAEVPVNLFRGDTGNDGRRGAVFAQQPRRLAALGHRDDGLGLDVHGGGAGRVGHGVRDAHMVLQAAVAQPLVVIDIGLGALGDGGMVLTASTGNLPAAVSPDSMMAEVPS